jgi:hypothetical protein
MLSIEDLVRSWSDQQDKLRIELEQVEASASRIVEVDGQPRPAFQHIEDIRLAVAALSAAIKVAQGSRTHPYQVSAPNLSDGVELRTGSAVAS